MEVSETVSVMVGILSRHPIPFYYCIGVVVFFVLLGFFGLIVHCSSFNDNQDPCLARCRDCCYGWGILDCLPASLEVSVLRSALKSATVRTASLVGSKETTEASRPSGRLDRRAAPAIACLQLNYKGGRNGQVTCTIL